MGCGSSTGSDGKICMKKTKLPAVDEFFDDVQGLCDEVYSIQDPIEEAEQKLLWDADFKDTDGANVKHAVVGIVFNVAAKGNLDNIDRFVKITDKAPFIALDASSAASDVKNCIDAANNYINSVISAKDKIEPLCDKAKDFAEKAPELPGKAKDELGKAAGLGTMDKIRAVRNCTGNVRAIAKLPTVVTGLKDCVMESISNIQGAVKEINAKKAKLNDIGKKCSSKGLATPMACYQECGDPIAKTGKKPGAKGGKKPKK
uniref:Uncharacterized protein n=1 Tax=Euplotes crassus TaxID=5936 RepID=A0A7S3KSC3_EUPCR|mmetsp:Transcript_39995/g.39590  ORF Transcript_39995/g.39590 Transcript_39995/m.39590 type:complete len:259 (+) Transcript_39995:29-805(+)|eukprot:CAMPEP_0197004750 /NCGR_PEP_ID=MMETSP1380-20130617/25510_1 /TAXON_ID=5936 /ORGANISM="Euplotes crassus, Strain CT5" /LENGTH=258 /DNA_ID=CAMNT_0042423653 /DNA_START=26 /DNA_END=802 /DNA_ORIENTATION=-